MFRRRTLWIGLVALVGCSLLAGTYYWVYFRNRCKTYVEKHYRVYFAWNDGLKSIRFVDMRTGIEEPSRQLSASASKGAAEGILKGVAAAHLIKAEGTAQLALQGCGEPYLVQWSCCEIPKLSELIGAAQAWNLDEVRRLLGEGMNVNARDGLGGMTPLMWAVYDPRKWMPREAWTKRNWKPDIGTVKFLLEAGANLNARDDGGRTALMRADNSGTATILLTAGADVNARDNLGRTPLMDASQRDDVETIRLEIGVHADVNAKDQKGWSALMHAARWDSVEAVRTLLAAGADKNAKNNAGWTALDIAQQRAKQDPEYQRVVNILSDKQ